MKEFDFNEVGRRMPYSVPEGFFEKAKHTATDAAAAKRPSGAKRIVRWSLATAAAITLAVSSFIGVYAGRNKLALQYGQLLAQADIETVEDMAAGYAADYEEITEYYDDKIQY